MQKTKGKNDSLSYLQGQQLLTFNSIGLRFFSPLLCITILLIIKSRSRNAMIILLGVRYNFVILQLLYSAIFTTAVGVSYAYPHLIEKKPKAQICQASFPRSQSQKEVESEYESRFASLQFSVLTTTQCCLFVHRCCCV